VTKHSLLSEPLVPDLLPLQSKLLQGDWDSVKMSKVIKKGLMMFKESQSKKCCNKS
jgi:hypothetical protein